MPVYLSILKRVKDGDTILDAGCCFGLDLRHLAADGAPTDNMYASDIVQDFWNLSYDLYRDKHRMKAQSLKADILDADSAYKKLNGKVDIILAGLLFHLFIWNGQIQVGKNMDAMSRPGTWIVRYQIGMAHEDSTPSQEVAALEKDESLGDKFKFMHALETRREMWNVIEEQTGTRWEIESSSFPFED